MKKKQLDQITLRNHNGTILYQGFCAMTAAREKRVYEYQTGNATSVQIEKVKA